ncbi:MetQ/NlpA family ABC transporter substrate-binding protein [Saccharopolyspora sp. CA-218241]|uniref:MetQ/NlpA family ABC transporter substrate-binding protein n=1 Tax=Saccharopolyspora sp. CA-218241 TaxID=3240027 RepID=UPI003D98EF3E
MRVRLVALVAGAALALTACGGGGTEAAEDPNAPLKVGVSPTPHGEILEYVDDNLAQQAGIDLEIEQFNDYIRPNEALQHGELDANYFQHQPYLENYQAQHGGTELVWVEPVHLEPLAMYSKDHDTPEQIPNGSVITLPNDPANQFRALKLLENAGLITLKPEAAVGTRLAEAVADNPRQLQLKDLSPDQLPRTVEDSAAAVVNGNYAVKAGLQDPVFVESAEGSPYANGLVTSPRMADDPRIAKLAELLRSPEVEQFIDQEYGGVAVVPAR